MLEKVSNQKLQLISRSSGLTYELYGTDRLYLSRANRGGYMLLFSDIKSGTVMFNELAGSRVKIQAERKNGQKLIGVVKFYEKTTNKDSSRIRSAN
ncbi:hypothetical protein [Limosilactobacillus fastidiosus]|nr:hypothetical protein [Limosilactobacillus fastidiosus]MCD7083803.1 hypothetical protein [Limosilactobacillus fastidiosus]MCD7114081.1 hypothetical protein [Limosilactobacillus fastidiosus]